MNIDKQTKILYKKLIQEAICRTRKDDCLSRIIQRAYEDETQLRRLKAWYNLLGLAIQDVEKDNGF